MSALVSIGEADHAILNADAEIKAVKAVACGATNASLRGALNQLDQARAVLAAVRLALRSHALADALDYHEHMAIAMRQAAKAARMPPGRGMYFQADRHDARAKALRALIGQDAPRIERSGE